MAYSQEPAAAEASPLAGFPALCAADIRLAPAVTAGPPKFPPQLTSLTLLGVPGNYLDVTAALREAAACISANMELQHLGCSLFRVSVDPSLPIVLPGVKSVLLEPVDFSNKQARVSDSRLQKSISGVLSCTPDVEQLELGACPSQLLVPASCVRLSSLSIRRCPLGLKEISCASLRSLSLSHSFLRCAVGNNREPDSLEVDLNGSMMDSLENFTVSLSSYSVGDTCKFSVAPAPGRAVCKVLGHQGDAVGEWVLSVGMHGQDIAEEQDSQATHISFECVEVHDRAVWEVPPNSVA